MAAEAVETTRRRFLGASGVALAAAAMGRVAEGQEKQVPPVGRSQAAR